MTYIKIIVVQAELAIFVRLLAAILSEKVDIDCRQESQETVLMAYKLDMDISQHGE